MEDGGSMGCDLTGKLGPHPRPLPTRGRGGEFFVFGMKKPALEMNAGV